MGNRRLAVKSSWRIVVLIVMISMLLLPVSAQASGEGIEVGDTITIKICKEDPYGKRLSGWTVGWEPWCSADWEWDETEEDGCAVFEIVVTQRIYDLGIGVAEKWPEGWTPLNEGITIEPLWNNMGAWIRIEDVSDGFQYVWVNRPPQEDGDEGCTPGYWKQDHHYDSWMGYSPSDDFDTVFGVDAFSPDITLGEALELKGGKINALARHAVAALLNATSGDVDYKYSEAEVIDMVQKAVESGDYEWAKDKLEEANEYGCPLD